MTTPAPTPPQVRMRSLVRLAWFGLAVIGGLAGLAEIASQVTYGGFTDISAYYQAAARLNSGAPLYVASANPEAANYYQYPPLLAIAFRPLALLPFHLAVVIWEAAMFAAFALIIWRLGLRFSTAVAIGVLGLPIAWALATGQAQMLVTLLLVIGTPGSVALAANLKVVPALVALYWVGRRDWIAVARFAGWLMVLALVQLVLAPAGTLAYPSFLLHNRAGNVHNFSPLAWSPLAWAVLVGAGAIAVLVLAKRRSGWAAAVVLSTLATPRLLSYVLCTLLATLQQPGARDSIVRARERQSGA